VHTVAGSMSTGVGVIHVELCMNVEICGVIWLLAADCVKVVNIYDRMETIYDDHIS
jgi:hypothetical protein